MSRISLVLTVGVLLTGCGNMIKNGALVEAQQALNDKAFADALESTDIAESFGDLSNAETAKLHYMRAQALHGLGNEDAAAATYQFIIDQYGSSAYAELSRRELIKTSTN